MSHLSSDCANPDCLAIHCVAARATKRALDAVNMTLGLQAAVTHRGDEVKCWSPRLDGDGLDKTYLNAKDCTELASAFTTLASVLERSGS